MTSGFLDLLKLLLDREVDFLVIGGVACALNGFVRATEDVDILVDTAEANLDRLLEALASWGEGYARELDAEDFGLVPGAVRLVEDFPLDIFTVVSGRTFADYAPQARRSAGGIRYLAPSDLIRTKQGTHREKDQIDILALQRLVGAPEGDD